MKKLLFIDRDGTLILEPEDEQVDSLEKLVFYPYVLQYLSKIIQDTDYQLVMVTNQDGLGTDSFPEEDFWPVQNKVIQALENEGIYFSEILIDRSFPHENLPTRKPGIGLLQHYLDGGYDIKNSIVIGDRMTDVQLAENLGCKAILLGKDPCEDAALVTEKWEDVYRYLTSTVRSAKIERETLETHIIIQMDLEQSEGSDIDTGIGFFNHMLEQVTKHAGISLSIKVKGDLHIDQHHTIEDVGIALGECFHKALGTKRGIERYGYMILPMDDCLAQVAIDFSGRPWLVWSADFKREQIGAMPTEMFSHFFKSFSDGARCNLNIQANGSNEHHKIEAIFKAFARAIKMAIAFTGTDNIPSTKGTL